MKEPSLLLSELPAELLLNIYDHLWPEELCSIQTLKQNIFHSTEEINFKAENHFRINTEIELHLVEQARKGAAEIASEEKNSPLQQQTALQREWLLPTDKKTSFGKALFSTLRGQMLAGRMTAQKAFAVTAQLAQLVVFYSPLDTTRTPLDIAIAHNRVDEAITLLNLFSSKERKKILTNLLGSGEHAEETPLCAALFLHHTPLLMAMLSVLSLEEWVSVLTSPFVSGRNRGMTLLYLAASLGYAEVLDKILTPLLREDRVSALTTPLEHNAVHKGMTPLYVIAAEGHVEALRTISALLPTEDLARMLITPLESGEDAELTPLYVAISAGHVETVRIILSSLPPEKWISLLTSAPTLGTAEGITPFYAAAFQGHAEVLTAISALISPEEWAKLLTTPMLSGSEEGMTPLCIAVLKDHEETLEAMLAPLSLKQRASVLMQSLASGTHEGETALSLLHENNSDLAQTIMPDIHPAEEEKSEAGDVTLQGNGSGLFDRSQLVNFVPADRVVERSTHVVEESSQPGPRQGK